MMEGWGLSHDSEYIYASDGTDNIHVIDPTDFKVKSQIKVRDISNKSPIYYLNELEIVGDFIYSNVLPLNIVLKIDKKSGAVVKKWDLSDLKN